MLKFLEKAQKFYDKGKPIISDDEFDYLATKYNYFEVGSPPPQGNKKVKHKYKMFSLQKLYDDATDREKRHISSRIKTPVLSPKLDGAAIDLLYNEGHLIAASTRGDGIEGDDIFDNMLECSTVRKTISYHGECQINGEIVAPKTIENARNYAAGAVRLKDPIEFIGRDLTFIAYGVTGNNTDTYVQDMEQLKREGFNTVISKSWDEFPQDGLVYRENDNELYNKLGVTSKHPRGAYAFKKRSDVEVVETKLRKISWQVGKGGKVTPVVAFEEIIIGGAHISKATLHNAGFVEELDLHVGDIILVTRSGGVIPKVVGKL